MSIRTIESHARRDAAGQVVELSLVQQAFLDRCSFQSGAAHRVLQRGTVLIECLRRESVARQNVERTDTAAFDTQSALLHRYVRCRGAVRDLLLQMPGLVRAREGQ